MKGKLTFISAGAGSGKTHRLTQLLHEHLSSAQARPSGVIATTFTRKAAAELRERAGARLLEKGQFALASSMEDALIGTVNSVCQSLLQRFCFEAGLSPELQVIEEPDASRILNECTELALDDTCLQRLYEISTRFGIEDWKEHLAGIVATVRANMIAVASLPEQVRRNVDELLDILPRPAKASFEEEVKRVIDTTFPDFKARVAESSVKKARNCCDAISEFRDQLDHGSCAWSSWLKIAKTDAGTELDEYIEPIRTVVSQYLKHPALHADLSAYITLLFDAAARTLHTYEARKQELGVLDFTDQEVLLLKVLDDPVVAQTLAEELDLLLVDEFQDTSPIQLALFLKLTALAKETYWVGDIKQAIYGFRGSDARLMDSMIAALPQLGGTTEVLSKSWRSRPSLVKLVNEIFVKTFPQLPAAEVALEPQRRELSTNPAYELWHLEGKNWDFRLAGLTSQLQHLFASGYQVVDKTDGKLRGVRPGDVAILCRSHNRIGAALKILSQAGIPYATGAAGLVGRPECILALACLRRLNDPGDTIATAEILSLADCAEPEQWLADRLQYVAQKKPLDKWRETGSTAHPILRCIARLRTELPLLSPREAMERVIGSCDLVPKVLQWSSTEAEARQRIANIDALLEIAAQYEDSCSSRGQTASVSGMMQWLDERADAEQDPQPTLAVDAVHVLTHHAAKGLEWPVVILLDLEHEVRDRYWGVSVRSEHELDATAPLADRHVCFRPWPFGQSSCQELENRANVSAGGCQAKQDAIDEEIRLLYVSMTRARDLLILCVQKLKWDDSLWLGLTRSPWLLPELDTDTPAFPKDRPLWKFRHCQADGDSPGPPAHSTTALHWTPPQPETDDRIALRFSPSSAAPLPIVPPVVESFGNGIALSHGYDRAIVGTAFHAVIAASIGPSGLLTSDEITSLLARHGVPGCASAENVRAFVVAFRDWLSRRWPSATLATEMPVKALMADGRIITGQIDLMLQTADALVIFDYKSAHLTPDVASEKLQRYAGQLKAYASAVRDHRDISTYLVSMSKGVAFECRTQD